MKMQMNEKLKKVQKIELEILEVVHRICVENNLKYSLAYGTLIGAIRHKGFIPWDDDIDICMPREDYNKFLEIWSKYNFNEYLLQNKDTDSDFTQTFTKIRKKNTTFLQPNEANYHYHKGIFIDIFPGDRLPFSKIQQKIQFVYIAINLLYTRGYKSSNSNKILSMIEKILLFNSKEKYKKYIEYTNNKIQRYNGEFNLNYIFTSTIESVKKHYPHDIFNDLILVDFEGKKFYAYKDYDRCLRIEYGDYLKLPPEEERVWKHTPELIDFFHDYDEFSNKKYF